MKMTDWQREKQKFLSMGIQHKRKQYVRDKFYTVEAIPTWKEYAVTKSQELPEAVKLLVTDRIDPILNSILVDKISIFSGDITSLEIDVIVNAANELLQERGYVCKTIYQAASQSLLQKECQSLHECSEGEAKLTGGYKLPAKYIIHTVGPHGEKPGLLQLCYRNSIDLMLAHKFRTIAFPCISTGGNGFPLKPAAHIAAMEVRKQLEKSYNQIDRVIFCLFGEQDEQIYQGVLQSYFPLK